MTTKNKTLSEAETKEINDVLERIQTILTETGYALEAYIERQVSADVARIRIMKIPVDKTDDQEKPVDAKVE
jgi:ribosomal protein S13